MKKAILSLVGVLSLLSCGQHYKTGRNAAESGIDNKNEIHVTITDFSEADFEVVERNDTIYYLKQLHEGLAGKDIQLDQSLISNLSAKIRFDFGFLQYTTDDNPASPLEYTKQRKWADLPIKEGVIEIPDLTGNSNNYNVYTILGFKNRKELLD